MATMPTKALEKKVDNLAREVAALRTIVLRVVRERDPEGEYKPEFVRAVLKAAKGKPAYEYKAKGDLLKQLRQLK
jgi:hypothetical protein